MVSGLGFRKATEQIREKQMGERLMHTSWTTEVAQSKEKIERLKSMPHQQEVEAGGTHEALVGFQPLCMVTPLTEGWEGVLSESHI